MPKQEYYELCWGHDPDEVQIIKVNVSVLEFEKLLDEYRAEDPEGYNVSDFEAFLKKKGYNAELIGIEGNHSFHF